MKTFGFTTMINTASKGFNHSVVAYKTSIISDRYICLSHPNSKFPNDKLCQENEQYILMLDGVVLNKTLLMTLAKADSWFEYLIGLYIAKGDVFFEELRGSFCGVLVDKQKDRSILFTDHIGSKFLYYSLMGDVLCCSTMIAYIYRLRNANYFNCTLSEQGALMLLTYGFMLENYTLCEEIKKVQPGHYVVFERGQTTEYRYCTLDNTPDYSIAEQEAIELYDREFRRAVALQFEKDREEYPDRPHVVALSGGLDCRMTSWVAHEMGYTNQLNLTFSQTDYWDETVPKQIAADLRHEWLFKALDNGLWLYNLDDVLEVTGGNVLYYGQAHGMSLTKYMNFDELGGISHSGQLGDVVMGTHMKDNSIPFHLGNGAYSMKYIEKLSKVKLSDYPNLEIGLFYCRYFNGTNNGQLMNMINMETTGPHMDWDALNAILKVPASMRYNHNLYKKWILAKYPKAADYVWETMGAKITTPTITIVGRARTLGQWKNTLLNRLHLRSSDLDNKKHMNPIGYYLNTNPALIDFINKNLADVDCITNSTIRNIIKDIISKGTSIEKIQAVTLVRTVKMFELK